MSVATDGPEDIMNADEYLNPSGEYDEENPEHEHADFETEMLLEPPHTPNSIQTYPSQNSCHYPPTLSTFSQNQLMVDTSGLPPAHHAPPPLTGSLMLPAHIRQPYRDPKYAHLEARSNSMRRHRGSDSNTLSTRYTSDPCHEEDPLFMGK